MSIELLEADATGMLVEHKLIHDLESVFWILILEGVRLFKLTDISYSIEDVIPQPYGKALVDTSEVIAEGSRRKRNALSNRAFHDIPFQSLPYKRLCAVLAQDWLDYYTARSLTMERPDDEEAKADFQRVLDKQSDPRILLAQLKASFAEKDWPKDDVKVSAEPLTAGQRAKMIAERKVADYDRSHLDPKAQERISQSADTGEFPKQARASKNLPCKRKHESTVTSLPDRADRGHNEPAASSSKRRRR